MIVIISEKRTMGEALASAILARESCTNRRLSITGRLKGDRGASVAILWFNGHVLGLKEPGEYHRMWRKWDIDTLPASPPNLEFEYSIKNKEIFENFVKYLNSEPAELINACDAGREGELIFREALALAVKSTKMPPSVTRMWIDSTTSEGLARAFALRKHSDQKKYNFLAEAAYRRAYADWILGINMTRYATAAIDFHGEVVHVGRVKTPVLGLIDSRDYEIRNYERQPYFRIPVLFESDGRHFEGKVIAPEKMMFGKVPTMFRKYEDAHKIELEIQGGVAQWEHIDITEPGRLNPPEPFSLLELQRTCSRIHNWPAEYTLEVAQIVYLEDGAISYPRTESHLLPMEMADYAADLHQKIWSFWINRAFEGVADLYPEELNFHYFKSKVPGDHHGIIPTKKFPKPVDKDGKLRDAYVLWELVTKRFILSMLPAVELNHVRRMLFYPEEEQLRATCLGEVLINPGWMAAEEKIGNTRGYGITLDQIRKKELPPLVGETSRRISAHLSQGFTDPPLRYTDDTLLEAMKRSKLGTAATRSEAIKSLVDNLYIERVSGGHFEITPFGTMVVKRLRQGGANDLIYTRLASYWEDQLQKTEKGKPPQSRENFLRSVLAKTESVGLLLNNRTADEVPVLCPNTGEEVEEVEEGFMFKGFPDMLFPRSFHGRVMQAAEYRDIIVGKRRGSVIEFIGRKSKRSYRAKVVFQPRKNDLLFKPAFRK